MHPVASVQSEYSLFERGVEAEVLPCCDELGIGFVPFTPLGRGVLAGSLTAETPLEAHDIRRLGLFPRQTPEHLAANAPLVQVVREVADKHRATLAQVALAWLLGQRPYVVPIPGSDRIAYLEDNVKAPELTLDADDLQRLGELAASVSGPRYSAGVKSSSNTGSRAKEG